MARYGLDVYGVATYGADGLIDFDADPFVAVSRDHGSLELTWASPTGDYDRIRLVRNPYGNPVNADDGSVILDVPAAPPVVAFTDVGLTGGAFYYYSLFVRQPIGVGFKWLRAGDTTGLVVGDYGYSDLILDRLPSVFTTTPPSVATHPDTGLPTPLINRFLSLFGFQLDNVRTTLETLRDTKDADRVAGFLLKQLSCELGQDYEPEIGQRQNRVLLRNSVYLYKKKGTAAAATGLASALAGWSADILPVVNLMLDEDDASAEESTGRWFVRSGAGVLDRLESDPLDNDAVIPPGAVVGYRNPDYSNTSHAMFRLTGTGAGGAVLATVRDDVEADAVRHGVPIDPAEGDVVASVFLRSEGASRVPTVSLEFYDRRGTLLTAPAETASAGATAADWTRRQTVTATPPAEARYLGLVLTYPVTALDEEQLFDAVQVEYGSVPTDYVTARATRLQLHPNRVNLITNPNAEVDTAGWTAGAATALTRSTAQAAVGAASFRLAPTGAGRASASTTYDAAAETTYTDSAYVYGPAGDYDVTAGAGASSVTRTVAVPANTWTRLSVTRTTDTGETSTPLTFTGPAGATFHVDTVLAERGVALLPYFDGNTGGTLDVGWTGAENASSSVLYVQRAVRDSRLRDNIERYLAHGTRYQLLYEDGYLPTG